MINLLPPQEKEAITYARRNSRLRHWIVAMSMVAISIVIVSGVGWWYIGQSIGNYQDQVAQSQEALKVGNLEDVQKNAEEISGSIKLIVQVLSKQILFSELIKQVGRSMPNGAVLSGIEISKTSGGLDLQAQAKDYQTATQVQVNLQDPANKLFQKADLVSVACGTPTTSSIYPCTVSIRALFGTNNPYLFINKAGTP